jgi:LacI family transcriptional regulator
MSDILFNRGIDGIILASHLRSDSESLDFDWTKFSAVKIDCFPRLLALHSITNDQRKIIQRTLRRVVEAGYRRVGFVIPPQWDELADFAWSAGFLAEQNRLPGTDHVPIYYLPEQAELELAPTEGELPAAVASFEQWFRQHRPEVIISHAPYVSPLLKRLGLNIPDDVAYADIFVEQADGKIAGVFENSERVGEIAVEVLAGQLLQNIRGVPDVATATLVEGTWVDGATLPRRTGIPARISTGPRKIV